MASVVTGVPPALSEEAFYRAGDLARSYTHVVILEPAFEPEYDGFRWLEPNHRAQVARLIRWLTIEWELGTPLLPEWVRRWRTIV